MLPATVVFASWCFCISLRWQLFFSLPCENILLHLPRHQGKSLIQKLIYLQNWLIYWIFWTCSVWCLFYICHSVFLSSHPFIHQTIYIFTSVYSLLKRSDYSDHVPISVQFSSVAQSCPTLCDPMNCSMPGLPVHHHLLEFTQTHVHRVSDAIQPSHPLSSPSPPAPNSSQHHSLFQWVNSLHEVAKVLEFQL